MSKYELIDSGNFKKLEQVGEYRLVRPSPNAVWSPSLSDREWEKWDAQFHRYSDGNGEWEVKNKKTNNFWTITAAQVKFKIKLTGFGHLGVFYEQFNNWVQIHDIIKKQIATNSNSPVRILNLFAYTGGSTLFSAHAGADVVHLDASKSSVQWARENAELSGLAEKSVRWIVDDVQEFVKKEVRREKTYHGIILDPPSYGRGVKNQVWKIEEHLVPLLHELKKIMDPNFLFLLLSAHSQGYTPIAMENLIKEVVKRGRFDSGEMEISDRQGKRLPSGAYSLCVVK